MWPKQVCVLIRTCVHVPTCAMACARTCRRRIRSTKRVSSAVFLPAHACWAPDSPAPNTTCAAAFPPIRLMTQQFVTDCVHSFVNLVT